MTRRLVRRMRRNARRKERKARKEKKNLQMAPLKIARLGPKKTLKMWREDHSGFIRQ